MRVEIKADVSKAQAGIGSLQRQLSFAAARTLNALAQEAQAKIGAVMPSRIDQPTPYTQNSLRTIFAKRDDLAAVVTFKDAGPGGRSAANWMERQIAGGVRGHKAVETVLRRAGMLPASMYVVPAAGAQLDVFGNWKRSHLTAILVDLREGATKAAARQIAARERRAKRPGAPRRTRYFVIGRQYGELEPGIYERRRFGSGEGVRPVVQFVDRVPRYRARMPFAQIAERVVAGRAQSVFSRELDAALASAR